jgi:hypothetical protein
VPGLHDLFPLSPLQSRGVCGACQQPDGNVIKVVGGDTIVDQVKGHPETIRLIGVDTP